MLGVGLELGVFDGGPMVAEVLLLLLSAFVDVLSHSLLTFYYNALCLTLFLILLIYLSSFEKKSGK